MTWTTSFRMRQAYRQLAGDDELIDFKDWKAALSVNSDFLARRLFELADTDRSGYIDRSEFSAFLSQLAPERSTQRLNFLFQCLDVEGDGRLSQQELRSLLQTSLTEQKLTLTDTMLSALTDSLFHASGARRQSLDLEAFERLISTEPGVERQLDRFYAHLLNRRQRRLQRHKNRAPWRLRLKAQLLQGFASRLWWFLYLFGNVALFINAQQQYADAGASFAIQIARGAGACLNLNAALILLPVCRSLLSGVRHTFIARLLPLDHHTDIHRHLGFALIFFTAIHAIAHGINYWQTDTSIQTLMTSLAGATGVGLTLILLFMAYAASKRQKKHERFVLSHLLYAPFFVALLYHGPDTWLWLAPSLSLFTLDAIFRTFRRYRSVDITALEPLSDNVTEVRFKRGRWFPFNPGDYIKVRIPVLSRWQWHPFTLSAAPETDRFSIHVRTAGNWTTALHNLSRKPRPKRQKWTAYIDGPYAAPTSSLYKSSVAVMIAGGIGVTPFASVIHSLTKTEKSNPETLYFHWLNRSQASYDWFLSMLSQAESRLGQDRLQVTNHLTSLALNLSNVLLQIAFSAYRQQHGQDPITGLRATTEAGRPDWARIFSELRLKHPDTTIHVYFCGPKGLGKSIRQHAKLQGLCFHEETFD
ncbi:EF-hand domain-containing protein [Reinekea blandensis]|nr:EF-hand domain-containing protein [Reinekea blandensis]